jgi:hypothetical protein
MKESIAVDNRRALDAEHLYPEDSPFEPMALADVSGDYFASVRRVLMQPVDRKSKVALAALCLPSFRPEWAFRLFDSARECTLLLTVAEQPIWGARDCSAIGATTHNVQLSADLADPVRNVWHKMLSDTRYPERRGLGLDGETYHFFANASGVGWMAGLTWSPDGRTAPGQLVKLSLLLRQFAEAPGAERTKVLQQVKRQLNWFQRRQT